MPTLLLDTQFRMRCGSTPALSSSHRSELTARPWTQPWLVHTIKAPYQGPPYEIEQFGVLPPFASVPVPLPMLSTGFSGSRNGGAFSVDHGSFSMYQVREGSWH